MRQSFCRVLEGFSTCEGDKPETEREGKKFQLPSIPVKVGYRFCKKKKKNLMATKTTFGKQLY